MTAVVVLAVAFFVVLIRHLAFDSGSGIGAQAIVSASSITPGSTLRQVVSAQPGEEGWVTSNTSPGAWIDFQWSRKHTLRQIVLDPVAAAGILSGWLSFSDGSRVEVTLSGSSPTTVVPLSPRKVTGFRFTVATVDARASSIGLSRVYVYDTARVGDVATDAPADGDIAPLAAVSSSVAESSGDPSALIDGETAGDHLGRSWSVSRGKGVEITLRWVRPRELDLVSIAGVASPALVESATIYFSDGSHIPIGAVTPESSRPTVVSFMPRATTSLRIVIDAVSSQRQLNLAEISTYQVGGPPLHAVGAAVAPVPAAASPCDPAATRPTDSAGLRIDCPLNGARVASSVSLQVALGPSYQSVTATILPAVTGAAAPSPVTAAASGAGIAVVVLQTSALSPGPFTVLLKAASNGQPAKTVYFQLYKAGVPQSTEAAGPSPAQGRSLAYSEQFDGPLSITRTGQGADYAAAKPVVSSVQDFGDAPFADPSGDRGSEQVVDNQYLQISVKPRATNSADPNGAQQQYVGGLLSSARPGGSGFSGQFAYFEARMLAPEAPGTWPAFWMLPSPNLVAPESTVAEIDAVELYGQFPDSSCQSTHQFSDGKDGGLANCASRWSSIDTAVQWHTYGVSVDPLTVHFYIDNKLVATAPQVRGGDDPLFFMVDLALGGGWPVDLAATAGQVSLYVDYIHVYE